MVRLPLLKICTFTLLCGAMAACDNTTAAEHTANGRHQLDQGEIRTAVIELKNALQKDPDHAQAHLLLGEAYARLGDYSAAQREYQRALDLGLDDSRARLGLLRTKLRQGKYQEVIDQLDGQGALEPPFAVVLAEAYLAVGDGGRAKALYQQGKSLSDGNLGLGMLAWQDGDVEQAGRYFERAVELDSENWRAWLEKGELALRQGSVEDASAAFGEAVSLPPAAVMARAGLVRTDLRKGELEAAAADVEKLKAAAPKMPMSHYLDAVVRLERNDLGGAEVAIDRVRRLAPENVQTFYLLGLVKYRRGKYDEAEQNLQSYLDRAPGNVSAGKLLASVRFGKGDYQGVVDALQPFLDSSTDPQLYALNGTAQMQLGHQAEATRSLERAVALAPDMAPFRNQLALSLMASGDSSGAEAQLQGAIEVDAKQFQSDYLLAMLHIRKRDWDAAGKAVEALIGKNPDSPIGYNLRGAVAMGRGARDRARAAFTRSLEADPDFLPALSNLAALDEAEGHRDQAVARYQAYLKDHPGNESALAAMAELARRGGDAAAAAGYLEQSVAANPDSVGSRLRLARLYLSSGRVEDAGRVVDAALQQAPDRPDLLLLEAETALRGGDTSTAQNIAARLQSQVAQGADNPALLLALGQLQVRVGAPVLARRNLERALSITDGSQPAALQLLARLDLGDGKLAQARSRLEQLERVAAHEPATRLLNADLLMAEQHRDEARSIYAALAQDGARDGVMRLAALNMADGDVDAVVKGLDAWLDKHPADVGARLRSAEALMRTDQDKAVVRYEAMVDTGNPVALNNLAWLYLQRKDPRAEEIARRALKAAPDSADILDTLGWVLQQSGNAGEAVQVLRRSVQLNPDNPSVQYHLGIALQANGDTDGARAALSTALESESFPEAEDARRALAGL